MRINRNGMTEYDVIMNAIEREGMEIYYSAENEDGSRTVDIWRVSFDFRPDGTISSITQYD